MSELETTEHSSAVKSRRPLAATGKFLGFLALLSLVAIWLLPTGYITESPGLTFDTLGEHEGKEVIEVDATTYPTEGQLDLTTVFVGGPPTSLTLTSEVLEGLVSSQVTLTPSALMYPQNTTADEVNERNTQAMATSQDWAVAAALNQLEVDYQQRLFVAGFVPDAPAADLLMENDEVLTANGNTITGLEGLRQAVQDSAGDDVELVVKRGGEEITVDIPSFEGEMNGEQVWQMGVFLDSSFEFPIDVDIALDGVGGPSAGMMFALGLIDKLTEDSLTGGRHIAGTGTIDPDGTVGSIGGVVQKIHGAADQGATIFLAPVDNCAELDGNVPEGITAYLVDNLQTAVDILQSEDAEASFATCGG